MKRTVDSVNEVTVEQMERLICQLPSVLKSAVSVNDWGAVEEIHVLTSLERTPKQIVRDVESALSAQWNLRVDHKRISVAQIATDEDDAAAPAGPAQRLRIQEYHMDTDALNQRAYTRVVLSWGDGLEDQQVTGEWSGRYLPSQYPQMMAWAATEAVNKLPGIESPMMLSEVRTVTVANRPVVMVGLSHFDNRRRERLLIGTAEIRDDAQGASVRAVLDAVNRKAALST